MRRADGTYRPYVTVDNKRVYGSVHLTWTAAESELERLRATRTTPATERSRTLRLAVEEACRTRFNQMAEATVSRNLLQLRLYVPTEIADKPVRDIKARDFINIYEQITSTVRANGQTVGMPTVRNVKAALKAGMAYALVEGWISHDVSVGVKFRAPATDHLDDEEDIISARRRFSENEVARFMDAIQDERLRARWLLQLRYGLRPAEVIGLSDSSWDSAARTVTIRRILVERDGALSMQPTKTPSSRRSIRVDTDTAAALDDWVAFREHEAQRLGGAVRAKIGSSRPALLFTQRPVGGVMKPQTPTVDRQHFDRIIKAAGVINATRYTLRHHALSYLVDRFPIATVTAIAGHTDATMIIRYYLHDDRAATASVASAYETAA